MASDSYTADLVRAMTNYRDMLRAEHNQVGYVAECTKCQWISRVELLIEEVERLPGPSLPELKESLDFNRLYAGDHRALYADHQAHFDAHYDALKAAEFVTWMEGHAPHTLKNLLKMYKRSDATNEKQP